MEAIDAKAGKSYIGKLENILGRDWCERELDKYREFRKKYSPFGMWSHRHPTTSPIVPLLFQYRHPESREHQAIPLGYWYGEPILYLVELASSIFSFEDFWSKLPNNRGINNIRYKLIYPSQFSGFVYELLVAVGYRSNSKYSGYDIEPLFFDPQTSPGIPDIVLHKDNDEIAIQCKTRSPLSANIMSFEEFQYLFGRFFRLIQDSNNSYRLVLKLKDSLDIGRIDQLSELLRSAIVSNLELPKHSINNFCDVWLRRLNIPISGLTESALKKIIEKDTGNLYAEIGGSGSKGSAVTKVAWCSISSSRQKSVAESVTEIVDDAASNAKGKSPLVISVHLYHYIHWESYFNNQNNSRRIEEGLRPVFQAHPRIKSVNISSNRQEFFDFSEKEAMLRTQYVEFPNPFFKT
jgi:hypothetical protein